MSLYHRLEDVPAGSYAVGERDEHGTRTVRIARQAFEGIGDYTRSAPTSPRPGRIYRKNLGWASHVPDAWYVFVCVRDPIAPRIVCHVPYAATIVERGPVA